MPEIDIKILRKVVTLLIEGNSAAEIFLDDTVGDISLEKIKEIESIIKSEAKNPLVKLDDTGRASILNYNVPNSTSYRGINFVILRHPNFDNYDWFHEDNVKKKLNIK